MAYHIEKFIDATHFFSQPAPCFQEKLFSYRMLASPLRKYVIDKIKDPLRIALEKTGSFWSYIVLFFVIIQTADRIRGKVGKVTKENSIYVTTHRLLEHKERFMELHHNKGRDRMMEAAYDIAIAVNEHDNYYQFIIGEEAEQVFRDILSGKWPLNEEPPKVLKPCWNKEV